MTQEQINRSVALVLKAREIIKELREAGLVKDSYNSVLVSSMNGIEKKLKKTTPGAK